MPATHLAIIGHGPRGTIPFGDSSWEFWGLNHVPPREDLGRYTRWFELHALDHLKQHDPGSVASLDRHWRERRSIPLYMLQHHPEYPDSAAFPREKLAGLPRGLTYHASSLDWMLALGIAEGFQHITLAAPLVYATPFFNGEPLSGRPCLEYWCGVAEGRGISVTVADSDPPHSHLFKVVHVCYQASHRVYGLEGEPELPEGWHDLR